MPSRVTLLRRIRNSITTLHGYEKLERSFLALNHLAAAIIAFRKVPLSVNIIYG